MKDIKEFMINESSNKETYFVLKVKDGKYKDDYIYADAEWWKTSKRLQDAKKCDSLNEIKKEKQAFEKEARNHYGNVTIVQVDITYKEIN